MCGSNFRVIAIYTGFLLVLVLVFPMIAILISFVGMFKISKKQKRKILQQLKIQNSSSSITRQNARLIRTLVVMTMGYYIMWTPYLIFVILWTFTSPCNYINCTTFSWLAGSNSFVNPLVYIPTIKPYRMKLQAALRCQYSHAADNVIVPDTTNSTE